ncbi:MAG: D-alanine--D-alanine ligase family protein [Planctomycetota bacterium]
MHRTASFLRVALLAGGDSAEREVSLRSGRQVLPALKRAGHFAELFDPAERPLDAVPWWRFDAAFLALHGGAGEDGRVQQWLEECGVPYTGSGPAASHLAMKKSLAKAAFHAVGVATPESCCVPPDLSPALAAQALGGLGLPLVVKPDSQGSSLGVHLVDRVEDLAPRIEEARCYDRHILLERYIPGRELTVAVLGRRPLPILEVLGTEGIFDYRAKYNGSQTEYRVPQDLDPKTEEEVRQAAVAAAEALGTMGLVRVDLILDASGRAWLLEVNTLPGMTQRSMAPFAASLAGIDMPQLCSWMLRDALARQPSQRAAA